LGAFCLGANAETESVLYSFVGSPDGEQPESALVSDASRNLYGTTQYGGANGSGSVFELSPNGNGGYTESVLYSFCSAADCTDGSYPAYAPLVLDSSGNLYGTTYSGGGHGLGTVFMLSPKRKETVLYSFQGEKDGANPTSTLLADGVGNFYGTTSSGGGTGCTGSGCGTIFKLTVK
jgi:uncharacterized repeat protein (TIGR03803 family)